MSLRHRTDRAGAAADGGNRRSCRLLEHAADRVWRIVEIDGEEFVTAAEAAEALAFLGVTAALVRSWATRGALVPIARLDGRPVYRLRDVRDVERNKRGRGRRRSDAGRDQQA